MFGIEDERHAEPVGEYATRDAAIVELRRLAAIQRDDVPNRAPCSNWRECGRTYELVTYDSTRRPWVERGRIVALTVSRDGTIWSID